MFISTWIYINFVQNARSEYPFGFNSDSIPFGEEEGPHSTLTHFSKCILFSRKK